jgi:hypothetical protein
MTEFEVPRRQLSSKFVFTLASVKDHSKLRANRNFVVKLEHFGVNDARITEFEVLKR